MIELKKILKPAIAAAFLAIAPMAASAAVVNMTPGGSYSLDVQNIYRFDTDAFYGAADDAGAAFGFGFTASNLPQPTELTTTINVIGDFTDLVIVWSVDAIIDIGDTAIALAGSTTTNFTLPVSPMYLLTSYSSASNGGNIDYRISPVPLPAAGFLLLGALGGLGVLRRRRKAA